MGKPPHLVVLTEDWMMGVESDDTVTVTHHIERFERYLRESLDQASSPAKILQKSMNYSLLAGGKRFRPLLVYAACESAQGDQVVAHEVAMAVEMFHTFSLIHDDLPAMDNDDYRRGVLTNHKVFGEDIAILAGDALHADAFLRLSRLKLPAEIRIRMIEVIADAIGCQGMVAGQTIDCQHTQQKLTLEGLYEMHALKTGRLIVASLVLGGLCAPSIEESHLVELTRFGEVLGVLFQIQDDLLDLSGSFEMLGKTPQKDLKMGKNTYPALLGVEGAQAALKQCEHDAAQWLARIPRSSSLEAVYRWVLDRAM
jgi:geranylgeranyl diphosphate synthase type II